MASVIVLRFRSVVEEAPVLLQTILWLLNVVCGNAHQDVVDFQAAGVT